MRPDAKQQVSRLAVSPAKLSGIGDLTVSPSRSDTYTQIHNSSPVPLSSHSNKHGQYLRCGKLGRRRKLLERITIPKLAHPLQ
jgi:hypothetical protein